MSHRRPIRIANASGAIGDGIDQLYRLASTPNIDAITADYLAEFNMAWRAIDLQTNPSSGYEPNFLEQLAWKNGAAARLLAEKKIKVVHDGGALNPRGLAQKTSEYFRILGIEHMRIAWVEGDNITEQVKRGEMGELPHLDVGGQVLDGKEQAERILAANAYTGQAGIVCALEKGADVVICGRCCDASPVMGLAYWWHGWNKNDLDAMAGSLMAGHLIECSAYVTGGNFCGFREVKRRHRVGYPIAEIDHNGTAVITKPDSSNGLVSVDTCKAQLLYEIQGPYYLNPDVVARIDNARLDQIGKDRVRLTGIKGQLAPPTTKLAVCLFGGYQAEISAFCVGLDTDEKAAQIRDQVLRELDPADFTTISIEPYGKPPVDPKSQQEATVHIRLFAQTLFKENILKFKKAIFYNGMQGYCGLHLAMDWRTMEPRPYVKYFPCLIKQSQIPLAVHFVGLDKRFSVSPRLDEEYASGILRQPDYDPEAQLSELSRFGDTVRRPLGDLVFARSGDKGGNGNIGIWVRDERAWPWVRFFLTRERIIDLLGNDWKDWYAVERCEFSNLWAVHFVIKGILQDGVSSSSVLDGFGKSIGEFIRARIVEIPVQLVDNEQKRRRVRAAL